MSNRESSQILIFLTWFFCYRSSAGNRRETLDADGSDVTCGEARLRSKSQMVCVRKWNRVTAVRWCVFRVSVAKDATTWRPTLLFIGRCYYYYRDVVQCLHTWHWRTHLRGSMIWISWIIRERKDHVECQKVRNHFEKIVRAEEDSFYWEI